jgi:mRNA interferase MazF
MPQKDFDSWNLQKKSLQDRIFSDYVHEREVWWCSLGLNLGSEEDGKHSLFERPVLVLKKFNKDTVLAVPLTSKMKSDPYRVTLSRRENNFSALLSQIRVISTKRLTRKIYKIDGRDFLRVADAIKAML